MDLEKLQDAIDYWDRTDHPPMPAVDPLVEAARIYANPNIEAAITMNGWTMAHPEVVERIVAAALTPGDPDVTTHITPPKGSGVMPCCGLPPFERRSDRLTLDPELVTCGVDFAAADAELAAGKTKPLSDYITPGDTCHIPDERPGSLDAPWMEEPDPQGDTKRPVSGEPGSVVAAILDSDALTPGDTK